MGKLERCHATGRKHPCHSGDEVVYVRYLREDVVTDDQVCSSAVCRQPLGQSLGEEVDESRYAPLDRCLGNVTGRVDSENRNSPSDEMLKEVTVVRCELHDEALWSQASAFGDHVDVISACRTHESENRREVCVLLEHPFRGDELGDLHEPTSFTGTDVQRIKPLLLIQLLIGEHGFTERRFTEVDHRQPQRLAAEATRRAARNRSHRHARIPRQRTWTTLGVCRCAVDQRACGA